MSIRAIQAVWDYSQSKGPARLVLLAIADGISVDTGQYFGAMKTIADKANYQERYARRKVAALVNTGELVVQQREGRSSLYWIPVLEGEPGYAPVTCTDEHDCNGFHTPIDVDREAIMRMGRAERKRIISQRGKHAPRYDDTGVNPGTMIPGGRYDDTGGAVRSYRGGGTIGPPNRNLSLVLTNREPGGRPHPRRQKKSPGTAVAGEAAASAPPENLPPAPPPPPPAAEPIRAVDPPEEMRRDTLWRTIGSRLRTPGGGGPGLSDAQYQDWIRPARLYEIAEGCYLVAARSTFAAQHLRDTFGERLHSELAFATRDPDIELAFARLASAAADTKAALAQ